MSIQYPLKVNFYVIGAFGKSHSAPNTIIGLRYVSIDKTQKKTMGIA